MMTATRQARRAMALTLTFDVATAIVAMTIAVVSRWAMTEGGLPPNVWATVALSSIAFGAAATASFLVLRIHRQVWRHMGVSDALRVAQGVGLAVLFFLPVLFVWNRLDGLPRSSLVIAVVLWTGALFIGRMIALSRSTRQPLQFFQRLPQDATRAVLVGDETAAAAVIAKLQKENGRAKVRILGLLQIEDAQPGRAIRGTPVMGSARDLEYILKMLEARYGAVPWVAVTGQARAPEHMPGLLEVASRLQTKVIALSSRDDSTEQKEIRPTDLLSRRQRNLDPAPVIDLVAGARILVTGGGGTIGLELARQCAALGPEQIVLFDASEYNLYRADLEMRRRFPDLNIVSVLGNVRDVARLEQTFGELQPEIVIHAAALKHVPLMENHVCEAVLTNVEGALNVTRAAVKYNSRRFVFISTDKAVDPDNIMGATKRLAEMTVSRTARHGDLTPALVRFGNVLGSSGSVVPLFKSQIDEGGPVTVTHPDVTRYFMTIEEAGALVLQAAAHNDASAQTGLFVLDMGEPIRIATLAEAMIRMRGMVPGRDIEIVYTGLRKGEKLTEALTHDFEGIHATPIDGVLQVKGAVEVDKRFDLLLAGLLRAANKRERTEALHLLGKLVPEYGATLAPSARDAKGA